MDDYRDIDPWIVMEGGFLKTQRDEKELSLRELEEESGIPMATLHRMEKNKPVKHASYVALARYYLKKQKK